MANKLMNITMNILNIRKCVVLAAVSALAAGNLRAQDYSVYDGEEVLEKVETNSTSAVSKVSGESLYKTPASNFTNTLIGIPGLTVMQGTGSYEDNKAKWLVRGIGSYAVSDWNTAKIFVDGFEVNSEYLTGLSASEVESVEVLKDGAALALYGERSDKDHDKERPYRKRHGDGQDEIRCPDPRHHQQAFGLLRFRKSL